MEFRNFFESTFDDLYQSIVVNFPRTTKRQYATDPVVITELHWTPFPGVRTLFVRGTAQNFQGGGPHSEYKTIIVFKNALYEPQPTQETISITANNGQEYHLHPLERDEISILTKCTCGDYHWRFAHSNYLAQPTSHYGRDRAPYVRVTGSNRPPANETNSPGMCKHLIKLFYALQDSGLVI